MVDRGHESPMDFEWQGSGPGDPNSPFRMSTAGNSFANDNLARKLAVLVNQPLFQSSPIKAPVSPPESRAFFFSTTPYNKTPHTPHTPHSVRPLLPPPIYKTPSFTTPRYAFNTPSRDSDIFSDGTPHTPDVDSEAPTPEAIRTGPPEAKGKGIGNKITAIAASPTPSRVTGRGELRRGIFHDAALSKVRRRQPQFTSQDFSISTTGLSEDEGEEEGADPYSDAEDSPSPIDSYPPPRSWRHTAKFAAANWVATHRELPLIAARYLQFFFNLSLLLLVLYALFGFYLTIRRDVDQKVVEYSESISAEMSLCAREYLENSCKPGKNVPAMKEKCNTWEKCMNRDPSQVGRARISAETFAEIINSFIEPISYKTMCFVLLLIFGCFFISNTAFGFFRTKAVEPPTPYVPAPPPTPSQWERQAQQQLYYESLPRNPVPSTPMRMVGSSRTPGRMGKESARGKEERWR